MTQVASHSLAQTRFGALWRAMRDSRPLTSLSGDQLAMGLSGLCLIHCLASTVLFASIASVSVVLENHLFHEIGQGIFLDEPGVFFMDEQLRRVGGMWRYDSSPAREIIEQLHR